MPRRSVTAVMRPPGITGRPLAGGSAAPRQWAPILNAWAGWLSHEASRVARAGGSTLSSCRCRTRRRSGSPAKRVVGRARSRTHFPPADPRGLAGTSRAAAHHGQEPRPQAHREPAPPPPARHAAAPVGPRAGRTTRRPRTPLRARPSPPARPVRRATTEPGLPPMHGTPAPAVPPPPTPSKGRAAPRGACAGRPGRPPAPPAAPPVALRHHRTDDLVPPVARSKL